MLSASFHGVHLTSFLRFSNNRSISFNACNLWIKLLQQYNELYGWNMLNDKSRTFSLLSGCSFVMETGFQPPFTPKSRRSFYMFSMFYSTIVQHISTVLDQFVFNNINELYAWNTLKDQKYFNIFQPFISAYLIWF